jgi:hypothetical protein
MEDTIKLEIDQEKLNLSIASLKCGIQRQKEAIQQVGFEPTWELFEKTFGWFQIRQKLTPELQKLYEELWEIR